VCRHGAEAFELELVGPEKVHLLRTLVVPPCDLQVVGLSRASSVALHLELFEDRPRLPEIFTKQAGVLKYAQI
jgi:hypothetical protein